jgi:parallel beta-helix repeat protein
MKNNNKLKLVTAITAGLVLAGCGSGNKTSPETPVVAVPGVYQVAIPECPSSATCSASGFVLPANAIYVAPNAANGDNITDDITTALFDLDDNTVVVLPAGNFVVDSTINISGASGLTLTGHGIEATILNFNGSTGNDGIKFLGGNNITVRDLAVHEANKNGLKADGVNGIHFNFTAAVWETPLAAATADTMNGAYGIYPVSSQNVLVENSYSKGSADAGIYVGQSNNVVVRNNIAEENVAGIEIENTKNADVYNNLAFDNSAGLLSFDLTGTTVPYGGNVRWFNNITRDNNTENVGTGVVGFAPSGTGLLVFATSDMEFYNNVVTNNKTVGVAISSYFLLDEDVANYGSNYTSELSNGWSPLVKNINITNNTFSDNGLAPESDLLNDVILGYAYGFNATGEPQPFPTILYGGIGELLSNAGQLTGFDDLRNSIDTDLGIQATSVGIDHNAYDAKDLICESDNINANSPENPLNIGLVYGVNPLDAANFNSDPAPVATLRLDSMENKTLLNCTKTTRLTAATVTINGKVYGCNGDDAGNAACSL